MTNKLHIDKWYTYSTYVDISTGELITKNKAKNEYKIKHKTISTEITEVWENKKRIRIGTRNITNECEKDKQLTIW